MKILLGPHKVKLSVAPLLVMPYPQGLPSGNNQCGMGIKISPGYFSQIRHFISPKIDPHPDTIKILASGICQHL
jgi:hypothetical protein